MKRIILLAVIFSAGCQSQVTKSEMSKEYPYPIEVSNETMEKFNKFISQNPDIAELIKAMNQTVEDGNLLHSVLAVEILLKLQSNETELIKAKLNKIVNQYYSECIKGQTNLTTGQRLFLQKYEQLSKPSNWAPQPKP